MSDYFSRLIARSADPREVLHPRVKSLFEREGEPDPEISAPSGVDVQHIPPPAAAITDPSASPAREAFSGPGAPEAPAAMMKTALHAPLERVSKRASKREQEQKAPVHTFAPRAQAALAPLTEHAALAPLGSLPSPASPAELADRADISEEEARTPHAPFARDPAPRVITRSARSPSAGAERAEPALDVHVSIGRIEVRAVHPPAAPAPRTKEREKTALTTLEDYLREREGGRR